MPCATHTQDSNAALAEAACAAHVASVPTIDHSEWTMAAELVRLELPVSTSAVAAIAVDAVPASCVSDTPAAGTSTASNSDSDAYAR